jgi:hypothetical protein
MELYGLNAFEPQVGPHLTYMVYFRPMSLTKSIKFQAGRDMRETEKETKKIPPLRRDLFTVYVKKNYTRLTFTALRPFLPSLRSKVTSSLSLILPNTPDECTKYSVEEFESLIKPKPFVSS